MNTLAPQHTPHPPLTSGTPVLCPQQVEGTVQRVDGHYVQVQVRGSKEEHWFPLQLLVALP